MSSSRGRLQYRTTIKDKRISFLWADAEFYLSTIQINKIRAFKGGYYINLIWIDVHLLVFNWQYCERKQCTDSTRISVYTYICVYRAEMADYLRTLPNLFDYFPGLGNDVGPCVTHHPRHLHAVPSGSVKQNMELLFNIQHKIRLLFNAQNKQIQYLWYKTKIYAYTVHLCTCISQKIYSGLSIKHLHGIYTLLPVHVHVFLLKYHTLFSWHIHKMSWGYTCEPAEENRTEPPFHWLSLFLLHPQTSWPLLTFYPRLCLSPIKIQMPTLYLISMKSGQLFSGNRDFLEYVFLRKMSLLLNTKVVYFRCNQFPKLNKNSSTTHWCVNYGHTLNSYLRSLKARTVST